MKLTHYRKFAYYVCGTLDKRGSGACRARYLNADRFESAVVKQIKGRILTRENLENLVRLVNEEMDSTTRSHHNDLESITSSINDVNHRLERLYDAIETGKLILNDVVDRIHDLRQRQEQLQLRRVEIESQISDRKVELADLERVSHYTEDLHALLQDGSLAERRAFIKSFIKEVRVIGDEAVLTYSPPFLPDKLTVEREGVLPTVQYGGR